MTNLGWSKSEGRVEGYRGPVECPEAKAGNLNSILVIKPQNVVRGQAAQHNLLLMKLGQGFACHVKEDSLLVCIRRPAYHSNHSERRQG